MSDETTKEILALLREMRDRQERSYIQWRRMVRVASIMIGVILVMVVWVLFRLLSHL